MKRFPTHLILMAMLTGALGGGAAAAEAVAGPGDRLTYAEALTRAVAVDERLRIDDASRGAVEAERRQNAARSRPSLDLSTNVITNNTALDAQIGGPGSPPRTLQDTVQGDARLEARWDFYQPGHGAEQAAFRWEIEASRAGRLTTEATVRFEAAGAYLDVLQSEASLRVAEADLERAKAEARLGRERLDSGEGSVLGAKQLDLAVRSLEAAREAASASVALASERLRHLLDLESPPELPEASEAGLPGRPGDLDAAALVAEARESRTEVVAATRSVEAAKERARAAARSRRPDAGFTGSVDASTVEGFDGKKVDTRMQVGVRWTFFDSGVRAAGIERETEFQRREELSLAALTRRVESEVRQALVGLRLSMASEDRASAEAAQAAAALEQAEALYAAGSATEMELSERRADLAAADGRLEAARIGRVRAFVVLRFAVGRPIPAEG